MNLQLHGTCRVFYFLKGAPPAAAAGVARAALWSWCGTAGAAAAAVTGPAWSWRSTSRAPEVKCRL